jgi:outer membrane immunogenic protein
MKKLLLGTIALVALATPAAAADLPARTYTKAPVMVAAYDWSGFYLGANGGYASSRKCWDLTNDGFGPVAPSIGEGCHDATGGTAGGQIGYRWQAASWVFGVEAQGNWADLKGSHVTTITAGILAGGTRNTKVDAFGLFTGQIGYAFSNTLLYVKGGAAVANDKYTTTTPGFAPDSGSETRWGAVVGAGAEFGFTPNWSFAVEYDHLFMGNRNVNFFTAAGIFDGSDRIRQDVDMVTARINYRFGGPVVAKY